jgi:FdhD protein
MPVAVPSAVLNEAIRSGTTSSDSELELEPQRGGRPVESVPVLRVRGGEAFGASDSVAAEEPLELQLDGEPVAVTMRTPVPGQDAELALGFLLGESIIAPDDVAGVKECRAGEADGGIADVRLLPGRRAAGGWQRSFYTTSSCGICGKASIDSVLQAADPVGEGPGISVETLFALPGALRSSQHVFERTGGLHGAALFDSAGELVVAREDVGRHNAVDKALGRAAMDGRLPLSEHVLLVSGRASFEIVQKALLAGVPIVAAVSAPSSLAVRLARDSNMTLVGFLRDDGFNVYAGRERVLHR